MQKDTSAAADDEPADAGKHVGTRLFTIIEQKSVPSLKTMPSRWDFQRRVLSLQPKLSADVAQAGHSRTRRRRRYSADDCHPSMHRNHRVSEASNVAAMSDSQSPERLFSSPPTSPVKPPYRPPQRMQTPTGLPRWPGETDHDQLTVRQLTVQMSRRNLLMEYLRRPPSRPKLKEVLRGERTRDFGSDLRTGTRFWRPPSSGHTTRRYDDIDSHPFAFVPIGNPHEPASVPRDLPMMEDDDRSTSLQLPGDSDGNSRKVQIATSQQPCSLGDSLRALGRAGQHAVPVSQLRASAQASTRSAAVPTHVRALPVVQQEQDQTSQSPNTSTTRTIDLFESFPSPPEHLQRRQKVLKRCAWSLFPNSARHGVVEEREPRSPKSRPLAGSEESGASNVAIRGESRARYRHSGTPLYDPDRVSLRTFDREREGSNEGSGFISETNTFEERRHTESQRAVSNGALRFSLRMDMPVSDTLNAHTQPESNENQDCRRGDRPEPPQLCKHKLAKRRCQQQNDNPLTGYDGTNLDGTSSHILPPPIAAQDHTLVVPYISTQARAAVAPVPYIDRPPTTTTFVTEPNGVTTFTTSPTTDPLGRINTNVPAESPSTIPGRA